MGALSIQNNGLPGLQLVNTFNPDAPLSKLLQGASLNIQTDLFNTASSRVAGTNASGQQYFVVNDGYGIVTLASADGSPTPLTVPLRHILADLDEMTFIGGHHHNDRG